MGLETTGEGFFCVVKKIIEHCGKKLINEEEPPFSSEIAHWSLDINVVRMRIPFSEENLSI